jgi:hypothetical protein
LRDAVRVAHKPPVSILFAAFLGYNPMQHLLGAHALLALPAHTQAVITGHQFFPRLISAPFHSGLHEAFLFAIVACLIAAVASFSRGRHEAGALEPLLADQAGPAPSPVPITSG